MGIADVQWSLANACVFALASTNGHLEVTNMFLSVFGGQLNIHESLSLKEGGYYACSIRLGGILHLLKYPSLK
jgi:hypothetical protein